MEIATNFFLNYNIRKNIMIEIKNNIFEIFFKNNLINYEINYFELLSCKDHIDRYMIDRDILKFENYNFTGTNSLGLFFCKLIQENFTTSRIIYENSRKILKSTRITLKYCPGHVIFCTKYNKKIIELADENEVIVIFLLYLQSTDHISIHFKNETYKLHVNSTINLFDTNDSLSFEVEDGIAVFLKLSYKIKGYIPSEKENFLNSIPILDKKLSKNNKRYDWTYTSKNKNKNMFLEHIQ